MYRFLPKTGSAEGRGNEATSLTEELAEATQMQLPSPQGWNLRLAGPGAFLQLGARILTPDPFSLDPLGLRWRRSLSATAV